MAKSRPDQLQADLADAERSTDIQTMSMGLHHLKVRCTIVAEALNGNVSVVTVRPSRV
jgi:hypothetical protein